MTLPTWPRAGGDAPATARLRASRSDFFVEEQLGFEPEGAGEHCWLWVEKEGLNTVEAARRLARFAGIREADIAYSGMKDRHAVTRQWFSLHLLQREVAWDAWEDPALRLLQVSRHGRKLRRGTHRGNRFVIRLSNVSGDTAALAARLERIGREGVPNYFGPQRFGRDGNNIPAAREWLAAGSPRKARHLQSLWLSSLRSLLFNEVLAARVADGSWNRPLDGELFMLDGTASIFADQLDDTLVARVGSGDVHPTGPLVGRAGKLAPLAAAAAVEAAALTPHRDIEAALERAGLTAERRALRLIPRDWQWRALEEGIWELSFALPRGCFATSVIREAVEYVDAYND